MRPRQLSELQLPEVVADVPPGVTTIDLGSALQGQGENGERDARVDPVRRPVVHRPHFEAALEPSPGALDLHQLLVAQGEVLGIQGVVVAVYDELAFALLGPADC
jgi:ABC-type sugar transport system ATPase subunit